MSKILFVFFLTFSSFAYSQAYIDLSEQAEVSIITFGPSQTALYTAFGHNGIRVYDPINNIDWMYDYGRFNFNQKNFYWNFARGYLLYSMGRTKDFGEYKNYYQQEGRYINEQVLNLSQEQKQKFFDYLENNNLPENRQYLYSYVYNNCATKIRDVVVEVMGNVSFDYFYVRENVTIRDLMRENLTYQSWGNFIIDVALGSQIDEVVTGWDYMFLPKYVFDAFSKATIEGVPIVKETKILGVENQNNEISIFTAFNIFTLLFFIGGFITHKDLKKLKRSHWFDSILFSLVGLLGWWFVFLWFGTEHLSKYNWSLIWAFPLHLPLIFFSTHKKLQPYLIRAYRFLAILGVLTIIFWAFIPQSFNFSLIPLLLLLILRYFYISFILAKT